MLLGSRPIVNPSSSSVIILFREGPSKTCNSHIDCFEVVITLNSDSPIWNIMFDFNYISVLTIIKVPVVEPISLK